MFLHQVKKLHRAAFIFEKIFIHDKKIIASEFFLHSQADIKQLFTRLIKWNMLELEVMGRTAETAAVGTSHAGQKNA